MRSAALKGGLCSLVFLATWLAQLASRSVAGVAQGWRAIAEPEAFVIHDVVVGHDDRCDKNKKETVSDVLVLWCRLLKWERHFGFALRGMPKLAASVHADERARALSFIFSTTGSGSFIVLATCSIVS